MVPSVEGRAVDGDRAGAVADVDDAQLAALEERVAGGRGRLGLRRAAAPAGSTGAAPPITKRSLCV